MIAPTPYELALIHERAYLATALWLARWMPKGWSW